MKKITLFLKCIVVLIYISFGYAQSPGGVDGAQVWFKTQRIPGTSTFNWVDYAGDNVKFKNWNSTTDYSTSARYFNFNPGLFIDGVSHQFFLNQTNLAQGTIIGVFGHYSTFFNSHNLLYGINARANEGVILSNDKVINSTQRDAEVLDYGLKEGEDLFRNANNSEGTETKYRERSMKVVSYFQYQQPAVSVWGEDNTSNFTLGYGYLNTANGLSTYTIPSFSNNMYGYIPEILVYSRVLNPLERRKAESYLAIKYGLSLSDSYISSNDNLVWDLAANKEYNNRITGIMRSDRSGLFQPIATTTYEDSNYPTDQFDSFFNQDPFLKSSPFRLLVVGQSPANPIPDEGYALWGDDNGALTTQVADGIAGLKVMGRKWKLNTNLVPSAESQKILNYNSKGMTALSEVGKTTFTNTIASSTGTSVTTIPLGSQNGYFEFSPTNHGGITIVKWGNQTGSVSTADYGVKLEASGVMYSIENTKTPVYIGTISANYHKVTMQRKDNLIYINVFDSAGNSSIATKILTILPSDLAKPMYGVISLEKKTTDRSLVVKHGGFVDTGSLVELSYNSLKASEFASNTTKSYLIVDRTGSGDFPTGSVDYYLTDEIDVARTKIIFNNVFWDTDGNGKDVFTFGYRDAAVKLIALEQAVPPTCLNSVLQQDGKINIEIKEGLPGYKYTLTKSGTTAVLSSGTFFENTKTLTDLAAGDYDLTLEMIGTNFEKKTGATTLDAIASTTALPLKTDGALEFLVSDFNNDKYLGFISQKTNLTTAQLNYGVMIKKDKLFFWNKGAQGTTALATLTKGSKIKLERKGNTIVCSVGGLNVGTQNIATADQNLSYFAFVGLNASNNGIYNLVHTGFVTPPTKLVWSTNANIITAEGDAATSKVVQKISLIAPDCKPAVVPPSPVVPNTVVVAPVPAKANTDFNINVSLNTASEVMVLIFNSNGILVKQIRNATPEKTNNFITRLLTPGWYVIKVLTAETELTKSILISQ